MFTIMDGLQFQGSANGFHLRRSERNVKAFIILHISQVEMRCVTFWDIHILRASMVRKNGLSITFFLEHQQQLYVLKNNKFCTLHSLLLIIKRSDGIDHSDWLRVSHGVYCMEPDCPHTCFHVSDRSILVCTHNHRKISNI